MWKLLQRAPTSRAPISNIGKDGKVHYENSDEDVKSLRGNEGWHHDSTYMPLQAKGAVFSAEIIPSSGAATGWADMRAAYEDLDDEARAHVSTLRAYHSLYYSQGRSGYLPDKKNDDGTYGLYGYHNMEVSLRPLVKVHPVTGKPNLIIGRHAHDIVGMEKDHSQKITSFFIFLLSGMPTKLHSGSLLTSIRKQELS